VRDAHGPLPQCTMSAGTRQAKNVGMASLGRQSLPVHTRVPGRNHSKMHIPSDSYENAVSICFHAGGAQTLPAWTI
jgi:hypothetical protein